MRIALYKMTNSGSVERNLEKSLEAIREASENKAELILFPEVQLTEFFPKFKGRNAEKYKTSINSDIVNSFCKACKEKHIIAVLNIYLEENGNCYDASLMIDKTGEIIGIQKMVHVAQAEQFYEQDYYTPSDDGFHMLNRIRKNRNCGLF